MINKVFMSALFEPTFFNYIYHVCTLMEEINFL
jgi:hypothetical protein